MHPTTVLPNDDPLRAPSCEPAPARRAPDPRDGEQPTARVPVAARAPFDPLVLTPAPLANLNPILSPPPLDDLNLSGSAWSDWDDEDDPRPGARRAPRVGDTVDGFHLVSELGRGAFARVYVARQEALAGREVALKVTLRPTREAERLARLQHTNIVPVYSVHGDRGAQLICMPFLGKVTIGDLLRAHRSDRSSRLHGRKTSVTRAARTTAFDSKNKLAPGSDGRPAGPRVPAWTWAADGPPPIVGDPRAVTQALVQLASGLAHAHERGILHLDLKPANVLLADTGEPMLLDFNLSFDAARPDREVIGGTMPYMAPEQLIDMKTRGAGALDERTDLFGLGAMAFEMLTGELPFATDAKGPKAVAAHLAARRAGPPSVRARNPEVPHAVEAIVHKLLAPEPADRYQTADELRTDLERHLNDLPLRYARETSLAERFGKWRRRNPGLAARCLVACLLGLALGLGGVVHQRAEANARSGALEQARAARAVLDAARIDLVLAGDPAAHARGVKRAEELLAGYGCADDPKWPHRPALRRLTDAERGALAGDLGELMFLLAQAKWASANGLPESERRPRADEAWKLNRAARACFPSDELPPAIDRQAALLAPLAGERVEPVDLTEPSKVTGTRARFLEAVFALSAGRYATAVPLLEAAVGDQPAHGAAQFCLAYCLHQLGQYTRALERYDVARALLPKDPRPLHFRGLIYGVTRKPVLAEAELTKALALDPDYAEVYRNRGLVRTRLARMDESRPSKAAAVRAKFEEADKDFTTALERGAPEFQVRLLRAAARDAINPPGAKEDREAVRTHEPKSEMDYLVRGTLRIPEDPKAALADLRKALELNPRSLIAHQNQAHVLADRLNDPAGALVVATRTIELNPEHAPARAGRAVLLARLGRREEAHVEIEKAQQLSDDPLVVYQAACVFSLTSAKHADDRDTALKLLRQALRAGYTNLQELNTDPDLANLRKHPDFKAVHDAAVKLLK